MEQFEEKLRGDRYEGYHRGVLERFGNKEKFLTSTEIIFGHMIIRQTKLSGAAHKWLKP